MLIVADDAGARTLLSWVANGVSKILPRQGRRRRLTKAPPEHISGTEKNTAAARSPHSNPERQTGQTGPETECRMPAAAAASSRASASAQRAACRGRVVGACETAWRDPLSHRPVEARRLAFVSYSCAAPPLQ